MRINKTMLKLFICFLILLLFALLINWGNRSIVQTNYKLESADLPEAFDGFRITLVSDLQSATFGKNQEKLLAATEETNPDIIVFAGDLLDRNHTDYQASLEAMKGLSRIAQAYYVNGNHELALSVTDVAEMYEELEEMGVELLFDKCCSIKREDSELYLLGLSEERLYESKVSTNRTETEYDAAIIKDAIADLTRNVEETDFAMLLVHEPQYFESYANEKIDLIFAGHAHGGQIRLPFTDGLFAPGQGILPKLTSGVHQMGNTSMVISRGLGNSVFPVRIGNRPEVVSVELKKV